MPRIISSSVVRDQFSASRLTLKVLDTVGHPLRLIMAFQVPDSVLVMVAICHLKLANVPILYRMQFGVKSWTSEQTR